MSILDFFKPKIYRDRIDFVCDQINKLKSLYPVSQKLIIKVDKRVGANAFAAKKPNGSIVIRFGAALFSDAVCISSLYFIIAHEYYHAIQYSSGELHIENRCIFWQGTPFDNLYYRTPLEYVSLPWEQEANRFALDRTLEKFPDFYSEPHCDFKKFLIELNIPSIDKDTTQ